MCQKSRKFNFKYLKSVVLLFIEIISISVPGTCQTTIYPYDRIYKIKVGDSAEYKYTKIIVGGKNYTELSYVSYNGSTSKVNITIGTVVLIRIEKINTTKFGDETIYFDGSITLPSKKSFEMGETLDTQAFVTPAFNNVSIVQSYVNDSLSQISAKLRNTTEIYTKNNYLIENFSEPLGNESRFVENIAHNWQTGWLVFYEIGIMYNNISLSGDVAFELISTSQFNQESNYWPYLLIGGVSLLILSVVYFTWSNKKRKIQNLRKTDIDKSIDNEKREVKQNQHLDQVKINSIDKSVKKLEEMISENDIELKK